MALHKTHSICSLCRKHYPFQYQLIIWRVLFFKFYSSKRSYLINFCIVYYYSGFSLLMKRIGWLKLDISKNCKTFWKLLIRVTPVAGRSDKRLCFQLLWHSRLSHLRDYSMLLRNKRFLPLWFKCLIELDCNLATFLQR